jgi:hypothetical protein
MGIPEFTKRFSADAAQNSFLAASPPPVSGFHPKGSAGIVLPSTASPA